VSLTGTKVVVGFHHTGLVATKFLTSIAAAVRYEGTKFGGFIERQGPYVDEARNQIAAEFLKLPYGDYLLMVDADIEFPEDAITKSLFVAESLDVKVVWGNYSLSHFGNSIFAKDETTDMFRPLGNLQKSAVYRGVAGGGTGWLFVHRSVLEKMRDAYPGPWHWFDRERIIDADGKPVVLGEDLTFGLRCHKLKIEQVGYTGLMLIHYKLKGTVPDFMEEWAKSCGYPVTTAANPYQKEIDQVKENANKVEETSSNNTPRGIPDPSEVLEQKDDPSSAQAEEGRGDSGGLLGRSEDSDRQDPPPVGSS
jgi:hypothetical protein